MHVVAIMHLEDGRGHPTLLDHEVAARVGAHGVLLLSSVVFVYHYYVYYHYYYYY